jgi:hypothetical protein
MPEEAWPDGDARYEFAGGRPGAEERWQEAIDTALDSTALRLTPEGGDTYVLQGSCPRCGHETDQVLEFRVIQRGGADLATGPDRGIGVRTRAVETGRFDVVCSCGEPHAGRGKDARGCGWGRGLPVTVSRPG